MSIEVKKEKGGPLAGRLSLTFTLYTLHFALISSVPLELGILGVASAGPLLHVQPDTATGDHFREFPSFPGKSLSRCP